MKIIVKTKENPHSLMRKCGYFLAHDSEGELSFQRPAALSGSGYPRFHVYIKYDSVSNETVINLHLDQKRPVYKGAAAHAAEYSGPVVEKEAERIKQILGL
jgi:hypothetical protein